MKGTKDLVLKTAKKLFGKNGLTKTSMDDIAADAGIGKGTIYHYYDSKEKLFIEVAEHEVETLRKYLVDAVRPASGPEEKLRDYMIARYKVIAEVSKIFSMFKQEYHEYYAFIKKVEDKFKDFEYNMVKSFLAEGVQKGVFSVEDQEFAAFSLCEFTHAMEYYFGIPENHEGMEKKANLMIDMIFNGLKKR